MDRRTFLKAAGVAAGALSGSRGALGSGLLSTEAETPLPEASFRTRHLIVILYGNGCRKKDTIEDPAHAPHAARMMKAGTVFTEDFGETANLHGYMYTEMLTGRETVSEHPRYPTWTEYARKAVGGSPNDYWMLQGVSYYRSWVYDRKHWSAHPDGGIGFGANSLTMNKLFHENEKRSPRELVEATIEPGLGHTKRTLADLEAFIADARARRLTVPASTKTNLIEREVTLGDGRILELSKHVLKEFRPKLITLQVLAMDDAHADVGFWDYDSDFEQYRRHVAATDELIGNLYDFIQADPYLRETTSILLRPECGRDDEVNALGQLHHSQGDYYAHNVWTLGVGPDFRVGARFGERVMRRDLCPTIAYLLTGRDIARHVTGSVRTQMFREEYGLPPYVLRDRFGSPVAS